MLFGTRLRAAAAAAEAAAAASGGMDSGERAGGAKASISSGLTNDLANAFTEDAKRPARPFASGSAGANSAGGATAILV